MKRVIPLLLLSLYMSFCMNSGASPVTQTAPSATPARVVQQALPSGCPPLGYSKAIHPNFPNLTVVTWTKFSTELELIISVADSSATGNTTSTNRWIDHVHVQSSGLALSAPTSVIIDGDRRIHVAIARSGMVNGNLTGGIYVSSSSDLGKTSYTRVVADNYNQQARVSNSQPVLLVDTNKKSEHFNYIYLAWVREVLNRDEDRYTCQVMFTRSRDGGSSFEPPQRLAELPANRRPRDLQIFLDKDVEPIYDNGIGSTQETDINGHVTVQWTEVVPQDNPNTRKTVSRTSIDGGDTFNGRSE